MAASSSVDLRSSSDRATGASCFFTTLAVVDCDELVTCHPFAVFVEDDPTFYLFPFYSSLADLVVILFYSWLMFS